MRTTYGRYVLLVGLSLVLMGCGGGGSSEDDATVSSTSSSATSVSSSSAASSTASSSSSSSATESATTDTSAVSCGIGASEYNSDTSVKLTATYSWTCSGSYRLLSANGVPNHSVGTFPNTNNPNTISAQTVAAQFTLAPTKLSSLTEVTHVVGFAINGVKFDPATAAVCDDSGSDCVMDSSMSSDPGTWEIEALSQTYFNLGLDDNNAHVQPDGSYHYHGMPEGLITKLGGSSSTMTLIGWAMDGFPIYARYGYSDAMDASSALVVLTSSYQTKDTPDDNRPSTSLYAMGTFAQDWEYVEGLGDLDECNGRYGVTPEFPDGTYYYVTTDTWPYVQRCVMGTPTT